MDKAEYLKNNSGLIRKFATKYYMNTPKFDYDDLVSIGNQAAIHALNKFDKTKGKVTTYVGEAVKREIRNFVSKNKHDLRVSSYGQRSAWEEIKKGNDDPLKGSIASVRIDWNNSNANSDTSVGYDAIPSGEPPVEEVLMKQEQVDILMDELDALSQRDRDIIRSRFFDGETLIQIANRLKVTKQRISQIENRAMEKLKEKVIRRLGGDLIE